MNKEQLRFELHRFYSEFRSKLGDGIQATLFDMYIISFINEATDYVFKSEGSQNHNESNELP